MRKPEQLDEIARTCRTLISFAERDGVEINDGNVVDLIADNLTHLPLDTIRDALVVAGLAHRFPRATSQHRGTARLPHEGGPAHDR